MGFRSALFPLGLAGTAVVEPPAEPPPAAPILGTDTLSITDGTTTVNLANLAGLTFWEYIPAIPVLKDGGIYTDSKLVHGRYPLLGRYENVSETIRLGIAGTSADNVSSQINALNTLLEQAFNTWTPESPTFTPVWLVHKPAASNLTRYAVIYRGELDGATDMSFGSFRTGILSNSIKYDAGFMDLALTIERGIWRDVAPNADNGLSIASQMTYNGITFGRASTSAAEVYVINGRSTANLTHIYRFDASAGTYSGNLVNSALPFSLFPTNPTTNDILYFGVSTSVTSAGPISGLVFDLLSTFNAPLQWEVYDNISASWFVVGSTDDYGFSQSGVGGIFFTNFGEYDSMVNGNLTVNGVNAHWVRVILLGPPSPTSANPQQQNRIVYATSLPYIETAAGAGGEIDALASVNLIHSSTGGHGLYDTGFKHQRVIVSSRQTVRGSNFTPFLNLSEFQNPSGISMDGTSARGSFASFGGGNSGMALRVAHTDTLLAVAMTIEITGTMVTEYAGRYRMFVRCVQRIGNDNEVKLYTVVQASDTSGLFLRTLKTTDTFFWVGKRSTGIGPDLYPINMFDLGTLQIPEDSTSILIRLYTQSLVIGNDLFIIDFILMPADEYYGDFQEETVARTAALGGLVELGNSQATRPPLKAELRNPSDNRLLAKMKPISPFMTVSRDKAQRFFFLTAESRIQDGVWLSSPTTGSKVSMAYAKQYKHR